jgi:RNA polymerase sigma-70 factor (ECF subfamily)
MPEELTLEDTQPKFATVTGASDSLALRGSLRQRVEQAYEDARNDVYYYLLSMGMVPADAQDITQETFLRLYVALRDGEEIRSIRGWVFRVAHNAALKANEKRSRLQSFDDSFNSLASQAQTPERSVIESQRRELLDAAIRELSPQQRQCLHLRAEGLRYHEIADTIGISISSVAVFVRRALSKLRRIADE